MFFFVKIVFFFCLGKYKNLMKEKLKEENELLEAEMESTREKEKQILKELRENNEKLNEINTNMQEIDNRQKNKNDELFNEIKVINHKHKCKYKNIIAFLF